MQTNEKTNNQNCMAIAQNKRSYTNLPLVLDMQRQ